MLCVCFAVAFFTASQPPSKSASRWFISKGLNLPQLGDVATSEDLFEAVLRVSSSLRALSPLSSAYVGDPMTKVIISSSKEFTAPVELPPSRQPDLGLLWTMAARIQNTRPDALFPTKKLIVRTYPSGDTSGLSCWAWYTWDYLTYAFEYGRGNLDDNYIVETFSFDASLITTDEAAMNMVSISANSTHLTLRMQDAGEIVKALPLGTVVSDCTSDTTMEVGDLSLTISSLVYHPYVLSNTQFSEIVRSGATLEEMASGMSTPDPGALVEEAPSEASTRTQSLVEEYGTSNLAVAKLSGALMYTGVMGGEVDSSGVAASPSGDAGENYKTVGTALPVDNNAGVPSWALAEGDDDPYWQFVNDTADMADPQEAEAASQGLSMAFNELSASALATFTVSWWSKIDVSVASTLRKLLFAPPDLSDLRFQLIQTARPVDTVNDDSWEHGYHLTFNNAPWCSNETDYPCMKSPAVACVGPGTGGFFGIWRHTALVFQYGSASEGLDSQLELFIDGKRLCGISFPADPELVPHFLEGEELAVMFLGVVDPANSGSVHARDARVYPRALNSTEVRCLGQDPQVKECLDLEFNRDNSTWTSEFGQTCADIASLSSGSINTPAACRLSDVKFNCPVSCVHEMPPVCHDGTPPTGTQTQSTEPSVFSLGARIAVAQVYLSLPELGQIWAPNSLAVEALLQLTTIHKWLSEATKPNGEWYTLTNDIRKMVVGTPLFSTEALYEFQERADTRGMYVTTWDDNLTDPDVPCPGVSFDQEMLAADTFANSVNEHSVIVDICSAEVSMMGSFASLAKGLTVPDWMELAGYHSSAFFDGLLPKGESYTLYFWARSEYISDQTEPKLSAIDTNHNVCFAIRGTTAWLQQHNLVAEWMSERSGSADQAADEAAGTEGPADEADMVWTRRRLKLQVDSSEVNEGYSAGAWIFFGLSVDVEHRVVRYAVNSAVKEVVLPKGDWGCDSLQVAMNVGVDMDLSPIRIAGFALPAGSLQGLYLSGREGYRSVSRGEKSSRIQRLVRTDRPFKAYSSKMVSMAPPMLFQKRVVPSNDTSVKCDDEIVTQYNERQKAVRERKCQFPYKCDADYKPMECVPENGDSPGRFFGQNGTEEFVPGQVVFPEFAWTLETEVVVRDGVQLRPKEDYIDTNTVELRYFAVFYVPSSRIATVVECFFDLSGVKIASDVAYHQIAVLSEAQFSQVVGWTIAGIVMASLSIVLAIPAAMTEVVEFLEEQREWLRMQRLRRVDPEGAFRSPTLKKRAYSLNTTQPDVLDILLNVAMIVLLSNFLLNQIRNHSKLTGVLAEIAGLDWASNRTFDAKVGAFMAPMQEAMDMVQLEGDFLNAAFWMLALCLGRMIIYMKIHPHISSITETFISVGRELVNFMFSFGLIFFFLAFMAHVRFGSKYDKFETISQSLITQFALLIGDSSPDYTKDTLMCLYVVTYVFICTLALLNFLLAIVVNGYTGVTERILENKVAQSFVTDLVAVLLDIMTWLRHPGWPTKLQILQVMQDTYPHVFEDEEEVVCLMSRSDFGACIQKAGRGRATPADGDVLFYRYCRMKVLLLYPTPSSFVARVRPAGQSPGMG